MINGFRKFKCSNCGNMFSAVDMEYKARAYSTPQRCPKCGSIRTYPFSILGFVNKMVYKKIWEEMEK